ncbi:Ppx/GppA phosphatase [Hyella patelloides LEGE 07179]|uniref:Ppx/GppA phosphatase n=1 Tax=Hyella patelloides LEGE 07179 TaxID=945734 RepID=A0A563VK68_9CYAN|nr:Ppx/GppA phosphatase family protein [Hyella patelloides]VEP11824.1 Ppx/GppA phosphatase [Hyella patelloides LEGE 07179]
MVDSIYKPNTEIATSQGIAKKQKQTIAAIDIGTNSIHMVVVEVEPSLPAFFIITKEKDTVRLGDRDPKTGNLTSEAIERSLAALKRCKDLAESLKVNQIIAVATSATREAKNGLEFLRQIQKQLGITVNLISGQEEARRIYLGVLSGMDFGDRSHVIIDIGGGSTELILADNKQPRFLSSTKVGAVRLSHEFVTTDPISKSELATIHAYVRGMLERSTDEIWANLQLNENPCLVGTSGTIETLAAIDALEKQGTIPNPLNGYELSRDDLESIVDKLAGMTYEERFNIPGISDRRAEIIVPGAIILLETMKMLKLDSITICERALREGIIVDWMINNGFIDNRLKYQSEVRSRNVLKIAKKYQVNLESSQRIAQFALNLFDQTKDFLHDWHQEERELLWTAAILHNCGTYISHSAHHKHSYYLIRNAELLGFTELELELIANIARYHRKTKPKKKHEAYNKLPHKNYQLMVKQLSAILRIAVALDRRQKGAIAKFYSEVKPHSRELHLHLIPQYIGDDCALELWSLDYKKEVFEEEYGVKLVANLLAHELNIS